MNNKECFTCERCGARYADGIGAWVCETTHRPVRDVVKCEYAPMEEYPALIEVRMFDGNTVFYKKQ